MNLMATLLDKNHIRKTFLTGVFAAIPLAVTAFIIYWINDKTSVITEWLFPHIGLKPHQIPFLGVAIALYVIYLTGMIANSLLGRLVLMLIDRILLRLPVAGQVYLAWKQIALTPGGTEGTFSKVVLMPDETGMMRLIGFTSARLIESDEPMYCVFVPSAPNPMTGRLYLIPIDKCRILDWSVEEAFKVVLSLGNYVPSIVAHSHTAAMSK
jgi:uncharacterized membrane protein